MSTSPFPRIYSYHAFIILKEAGNYVADSLTILIFKTKRNKRKSCLDCKEKRLTLNFGIILKKNLKNEKKENHV